MKTSDCDFVTQSITVIEFQDARSDVMIAKLIGIATDKYVK